MLREAGIPCFQRVFKSGLTAHEAGMRRNFQPRSTESGDPVIRNAHEAHAFASRTRSRGCYWSEELTNRHQSSIRLRRLPSKSPRRYARSTAFVIVCANALSATSCG